MRFTGMWLTSKFGGAIGKYFRGTKWLLKGHSESADNCRGLSSHRIEWFGKNRIPVVIGVITCLGLSQFSFCVLRMSDLIRVLQPNNPKMRSSNSPSQIHDKLEEEARERSCRSGTSENTISSRVPHKARNKTVDSAFSSPFLFHQKSLLGPAACFSHDDNTDMKKGISETDIFGEGFVWAFPQTDLLKRAGLKSFVSVMGKKKRHS